MTSIDGNLSLNGMQADFGKQDARLARASNEETADRAEIRKVAEEFESLFLNLVLKSMRNTVQKSGFIDGGNAEDIYRSMLDDEYAKMMAAQRHTGIANQIEDFLLQATGAKKDDAAAAVKATGLKAYEGAALQSPAKQATMTGRETPRLKAL